MIQTAPLPICEISTEKLGHEHRSVVSLLAEFFEIDLNKIEAEKRALLDEVRKGARNYAGVKVRVGGLMELPKREEV